MNIEGIFRKIPDFENLIMDTVLFESRYPVLFTCVCGDDIYLFICCLVHASIVKWIGTRTDYDTLVGLLENQVTIRDAFLGVTEEKMLIEYDGKTVIRSCVKSGEIEECLLPTAGEYMDAEEDEFTDELANFKRRGGNEKQSLPAGKSDRNIAAAQAEAQRLLYTRHRRQFG